jgi:beta-aspartyl-peptidase (threonine type)
MEGKGLNAGAVAGISGIKNPILAAKEVMIHSKHVMLSGKGAYDFAVSRGLEEVPPSYYFTKESLKRYKNRVNKNKKHGTVGCIALDKSGNIVAGTSTGGTSHKQYGRIGDSPIIGAGTYANNNTCGVSCTGIGEYFIRLSVAHDISTMMEYRSLTVQQAVDTIIQKKLPALGGKGGIIALDKYGHTGIGFNTRAMSRGYKKSDGTENYQLY